MEIYDTRGHGVTRRSSDSSDVLHLRAVGVSATVIETKVAFAGYG
jgi:hypothetical protein